MSLWILLPLCISHPWPWVCHYLVCTVHAGHRPLFPLVLKTTWNTIRFVRSFIGMPYMAASFPSSSIIPRTLLHGLWLTEVFTCLKMYEAINRSYFLSIPWCCICSFFFLPICQIDRKKHVLLISSNWEDEQQHHCFMAVKENKCQTKHFPQCSRNRREKHPRVTADQASLQ